jgi:hypothetical protein
MSKPLIIAASNDLQETKDWLQEKGYTSKDVRIRRNDEGYYVELREGRNLR